MKQNISKWTMSMVALLFLTSGLLAQEQVEVSVKVKKDGKLVTDTTYLFDDAAQAKQAMKMMQLMSGDEEHMEHITYNYTTALPEGSHGRTMVFISKDGESTEISEIQEDSLIWITEKEVDGDHVVMKKEIKVVVSEDDDATWHVEGDDMIYDKDENVYIIKGDDEVKVKVIKIMEDEAEGEKVKVIVIEGGEDADVDLEHDEDVEVKIIKKAEEK